MDTKISISLLDNAIDELDCFAMEADTASDYIRNVPIAFCQESRSFKQAVKHLFNAGELLLKYRLQEEHWAFIFEKVNDATKEKLEKGEFKSVTFEDAVKRLKNITGMELNLENFSKLNKLRNKIEHFEFNIERIELLNIIIFSLEELLTFISEIKVESERLYDAIERAEETKHKLIKCKNKLKN